MMELSERMLKEIESDYFDDDNLFDIIHGWSTDVFQLEVENEQYEGGLKHIKRWANSYNVHVNPRVILNAVVRMCDDALLREPE